MRDWKFYVIFCGVSLSSLLILTTPLLLSPRVYRGFQVQPNFSACEWNTDLSTFEPGPLASSSEEVYTTYQDLFARISIIYGYAHNESEFYNTHFYHIFSSMTEEEQVTFAKRELKAISFLGDLIKCMDEEQEEVNYHRYLWDQFGKSLLIKEMAFKDILTGKWKENVMMLWVEFYVSLPICLCLILAIVIYCVLWKVRKNVPIWIQFSLILSKTLEPLLYVLIFAPYFIGKRGIDIDLVMQTFKNHQYFYIVVHIRYFLDILQVMWLSVLNFDLYKTFRSFTLQRGSREMKKDYLIYFAFAMITSSLTASTSYLLEIYAWPYSVDVDDSSVTQWETLVYRTGVLVVISLLNLYFCVCTIMGIKKAKKETQRATKDSSSRAQLFIKLFGIMFGSSLIQTMAKFATTIHVQYFQKPYEDSILNEWVRVASKLDSLLIFFLLVCTRRTYIELKKQCCPPPQDNSSNVTGSTPL